MSEGPFLRKVSHWEKSRSTFYMIVGLGVFFGLVYPIFGDGFSSIYPFINGFIIGLSGSLIIAYFEQILFYRRGRNLSILTFVTLKVISYAIVFTLLVLFVLLISRSFEYGKSIHETWHSAAFQHLLYQEDFITILAYTLILVFVVIFLKEINRKIGQGVLLNFIIGQYRHPKRLNRVFMFLDLSNSSLYAEKLHDLQYHNFLHDFFYDITESILYTKGEIYQYVGDEVVVSWPLNKGIKNANCIKTYFYARQHIISMSDKYLKKYGFVPRFKAAFHCGVVVRGEVGDIKSEIAFHGDAINTTSRLERLCSELNEPILVSKNLYEKLPKTSQSYLQYKGAYKLKGKEKEMDVFGVIDKFKTE